MREATKTPGRIVTFYSYKGGTGRSMALANVAWVLAASGLKVLAVDWDFEAPGLHRYFHPFLKDPDLGSTRGLIDLLWDYVEDGLAATDSQPDLSLADPWMASVALEFPLDGNGCLHLLPAGRQDASYAAKVREFDWRAFYGNLNGGAFLDAFAARMRERYDVVLIDSRTGVSDTAGICTVHLPDTVVLCFTCNRQSALGVQAVGQSIRAQRKDMRLLPVAMRVERGADGLADARKFVREALGGLQPHADSPDAAESYWGAAEIPHYPDYAFEETLAVFRELPRQRSGALADMEWLAGEILGQSPIQFPILATNLREKILRRFKLNDPRLADIAEAMGGEPQHAMKRLMEHVGAILPEAASDAAFARALAEALLKCGTRLRDLGNREDAHFASREALSLARALPTGDEANLALLARVLRNLGVALSELGRREEAHEAAAEAVDVNRELARTRPDAFRPDLAASLNNLANMLSDLGRSEEALAAIEEAVDIRRELARARPDSFRPDLAMSLNNLANRRSDLGRPEAALEAIEEAVGIYRELAGARPDAFRPDLATSLNNIAAILSALGRCEQALEAIEEAADIYRELALARPDAFRPNLAAILNTLSNGLSDLGRHEAAQVAIEEAAHIHRELARARPDAFRPDLAMSLNNLSNRLSALGRHEQALEAIQDAVDIRRALASARPDAFRPDLAMSLNNLAASLFDLDRPEAALAVVEQAVAIRRELASTRPDAFRPDLAMSCGVRGSILGALGRSGEAAESFREGLELLLPFAERLPQVFGDLVTYLAKDYRDASEAAGTEPDDALLTRAVAVLKASDAAALAGPDPIGAN